MQRYIFLPIRQTLCTQKILPLSHDSGRKDEHNKQENKRGKAKRALHAAGHSQRGGNSGDDANDDLKNQLPSFFIHSEKLIVNS